MPVRAITILEAIQKRSHEQDLKNDTKNKAKILWTTTFAITSYCKVGRAIIIREIVQKCNIAAAILVSPTSQSVPKKITVLA